VWQGPWAVLCPRVCQLRQARVIVPLHSAELCLCKPSHDPDDCGLPGSRRPALQWCVSTVHDTHTPDQFKRALKPVRACVAASGAQYPGHRPCMARSHCRNNTIRFVLEYVLFLRFFGRCAGAPSIGSCKRVPQSTGHQVNACQPASCSGAHSLSLLPLISCHSHSCASLAAGPRDSSRACPGMLILLSALGPFPCTPLPASKIARALQRAGESLHPVRAPGCGTIMWNAKATEHVVCACQVIPVFSFVYVWMGGFAGFRTVVSAWPLFQAGLHSWLAALRHIPWVHWMSRGEESATLSA